jgi:hypothetical protein
MPMLEGFQFMRGEGSGELDNGCRGDRGTRRFIQVHVVSMEDRYILLAI